MVKIDKCECGKEIVSERDKAIFKELGYCADCFDKTPPPSSRGKIRYCQTKSCKNKATVFSKTSSLCDEHAIQNLITNRPKLLPTKYKYRKANPNSIR